MSYFFWESNRWLGNPLCCRYLGVVRFGRQCVPMRHEESASAAQWHWALGLFTDGWLEVLGAVTPQRIAAGLHGLGIKRIKSLRAWSASLQIARLNAAGEVRERQVKSRRKPVQNADRGLLLAHFNQRNERTVKVATACKVLLRQRKFLPARLDLDGERIDELLISAGSHRPGVFLLRALKTRVY